MTMRPPGWDEVLRRMPTERLASVAASIGLEEFELTAYLVVEGAGRPAEGTPWWPEALAMRAEGTSLREIARRFQTDPRRLRRALARQGLRVHGVDLAPGTGAEALVAVRERIGNEPDRVVAKAAGVIPQAVKGERRRLGLAAYWQRPRVRLTADDEAWIRGPKKLRRERFRPEPDVLQVVRRPQTRPGEDLRPSRTDEGVRRPEPARVSPSRPHSEGPGRSFFRDDRWSEIERLTEPTQRRDGNRRLVRSPDVARPLTPSTVEANRRPEPESTPAVPAAGLPGLPPVVGTRRLVTPPRPVGSPVPREAAPRAVTAVAVAPEVVPVQGPAEVPWRIEVPGWENTVTVFATDIAGAVRKAAEKVPAHLLARSSVWRADQPAPGVDSL